MAPTYWIIKVIWPEGPFYLYRHIDMSWLARWQKNWFKTHEILSYNVTVIKTCRRPKVTTVNVRHLNWKFFIKQTGGFSPFRNNIVLPQNGLFHCICTYVLKNINYFKNYFFIAEIVQH